MHKLRVLFVCVGNTARSQMAEALLQHHGGERFEVMSAGFEPGIMNPYVIRAMHNIDIDLSGKTTKSVYALFKQQLRFDYVISVCDGAHAQKCPVFPGKHVRLSWTYDDPAKLEGDDARILAQVERIREEIRRDVLRFLDEIEHGRILFDTRKQPEKKYVNSLLLQLLFNQIGSGVIIVDAALNVLEMNFAFAKAFDTQEADLVGRPLESLFAGDTPLIELLQAYGEDLLESVEMELIHGMRIFFVNASKVVMGEEDRYIIVTFTDITLGKKGIQLQKQFDYLQTVIDAQPGCIFVNDGNELLFANRSLLNFLGYDSLDTLRAEHHCVCDFFEPVDGYARDMSDVLALSADPAYPRTLTRIRSRIFQIGVNRLEGTGHYVVTLTDVTDRERYNARLEAQNQTQQMLLIERAKQAQLGEIFNLVIHQWRQPLNAISVMSAVILRRLQRRQPLEKGDLLQKHQRIAEMIRHMDDAINDFRSFFRPDEDKSRVYASALIEQTLQIVRNMLRTDSIDLRVQIDDDVELYVYPNEFKHVLLNLIKNAEDAWVENAPADATVTIRAQMRGGACVISVSDHCGGIDAALLPGLFDKHVSSKGDQGSGLGLYMSKMMITEHMGGRIRAFNIDGGARFEVELPVV